MAPTLSRIEISKDAVFELYLSKLWATPKTLTNEEKNKIRTKIHEDVKQKNPKQFSISHCPLMGGFSTSHVIHGLDMEDPERVTLSAAARIASKVDMANAPSPEALWVAKESSFKCLSNKGLKIGVLSEIKDFSFHQNSQDSWSFQALKPYGLEGLVWRQERLILGLTYLYT